jgi:glutaredoxin 2
MAADPEVAVKRISMQSSPIRPPGRRTGIHHSPPRIDVNNRYLKMKLSTTTVCASSVVFLLMVLVHCIISIENVIAFPQPQPSFATATTRSFDSTKNRSMMMTMMMSSSSTTEQGVMKFNQPERVVRPDLPILYVYDHCPFCVRVRAAFGLKNIKHNIVFLANDDVETPTKLVGKKISPILKWDEADICMPESMDIVLLADGDARLGPTGMIRPDTGRSDLKAWQKSVQNLLRGLQRPRYVATGLLPEFATLDGRHAFIKNHEMVGYSKDEWKKGDMVLVDKIRIYEEALAKDPASDIEELNRQLIELDDILFCEYHCSPGGISMDDIDLFARLRSITIIKNVTWPKKLRHYMDYLSDLTDIALYDAMAM